MADINNKVTDLEIIGIEQRAEENRRSEAQFGYSKNDPYDENHKNAQSDGDEKGKGYNGTSRDYILPHEGLKTTYLHTIETSDGGSSVDKNARDAENRRRLYSETNVYGKNSVEISDIDGQFVVK